ncbi:gp53-like domain-containing protein [Chromobacterium haemolyticum]|uniref:gp53-like domain-containing protein n=1 Tax=Chromobacterium haemolyticum TaxID=394935 RepID=UPI001B3BEB41|nr:hypothetical protein [Chromobacterium haemolyticum]
MGYLNDKEEWVRVPYFAEDAVLTGGPDCPDNIPIQALTNRTALLKKRLDDAVAGALAIEYANKLSTARKIGMSGDGSWSVQFDGGGNVSAALTLADSGVEAGTYPVLTVDKKGRATDGRALQSADLPINAALPGEPTVKTPPAGASDKRIVNAEFVAGALAALVGSAPAVLDTLNELAAALGNDPNFAATMAAALAAKAPLVDAHLRGEPTAPTPPQFDNSDRLATTAAVKAAGLTFSGVTYMNSLPAVVDTTLAGKLIVINGGASSTVSLPLSSGGPKGATITLVNESNFAQTITRQGTDIIIAGNSNSANAYTMEAGTFAVFIADAGGWHMGLRTAQLGLTGAFAGTNNTLRFPGGQMLQFGTGVTNSSGVVSITFPLAFSSPPVVIPGNVGGNFNHSISLFGNNAGFTDSLYIANTGAMAGAGITSFWLAIGK